MLPSIFLNIIFTSSFYVVSDRRNTLGLSATQVLLLGGIEKVGLKNH